MIPSMSKMGIWYISFLLLTAISSCFQDEALLKKQLYNLENVIIEEKTGLEEEQYTLSINFTAELTSHGYSIKLIYPNLQKAEGENKGFASAPIIRSLYGFSLELYEIKNSTLIYSCLITENSQPAADPKTCSLVLAKGISLFSGNNYELRLIMPGKKDTSEKYSLPVMVMGTIPAD
jgi:hypothetical protein